MSRAESPFLVAAAQLTGGDDVEANLANCKQLAVEAASRGAVLLVLPECFAFIGRHEGESLRVAETLDVARPGRILAAVQEIATRHKMWVVAGGMPEKAAAGADGRERVSNSSIAVAPDGRLVAVYRKIHLFDVAIPGRAEHRESASTAAGREVVAVETAVGKLGLTICYDLRFPELYRALAIQHGAEILTVPAAFTAHTGAAHWHVLLRARAIENQCYVVAAGQVGQHNPHRRTFGHSMIIDPWGTVLAELDAGGGLAVAEIDLARLDQVRREMPCRDHRVLS
jgi:deaminated glutathione amidase